MTQPPDELITSIAWDSIARSAQAEGLSRASDMNDLQIHEMVKSAVRQAWLDGYYRGRDEADGVVL